MEEYELYHHGILGQKWGIRRFQNPDGSLTSAGKKRYAKVSREIEENEKKKADLSVKRDKVESRIRSHYLTDIGKYRQQKNINKVAIYNKKIKDLEGEISSGKLFLEKLFSKENR